MPWIIENSASGPRRHELMTVSVFVGRDADNDIQPDGKQLSRQHCVFERGPDGWQVRDLGSTNGTTVGGMRIDTHVLVHGDRVRCGDAELCFVDEQADRMSTARPAAAKAAKATKSSKVSSMRSPADRGGSVIGGRSARTEGRPARATGSSTGSPGRGVAGAGGVRSNLGLVLGLSAAGGLLILATAITLWFTLKPGTSLPRPVATWFLIREAGAQPEGPLTAMELRRAFRWGDIAPDTLVRDANGADWQRIADSALASGYDEFEPQSAEQVPLDLQPIDFMRQMVDFCRFDRLAEAHELLVLLIDVDASLAGVPDPGRIKPRIKSMMTAYVYPMEAKERLDQILKEANAAGRNCETFTDEARVLAEEARIRVVDQGDKVQILNDGTSTLGFLRTDRGWRIDLFSGPGLRDVKTGQLSPLITGGIAAAGLAGGNELTNEERAMEVIPTAVDKAIEKVKPYLLRGCFPKAKSAMAAFQQVLSVYLMVEIARRFEGNAAAMSLEATTFSIDYLEQMCESSQ